MLFVEATQEAGKIVICYVTLGRHSWRGTGPETVSVMSGVREHRISPYRFDSIDFIVDERAVRSLRVPGYPRQVYEDMTMSTLKQLATRREDSLFLRTLSGQI